ncbi:MAG: UvrD-helicase domain-containing protein [Deltaproteobacteria bacterium]|nr:UvrD-helicase domain-containing protein [Deltaproteobacteria bacterium]
MARKIDYENVLNPEQMEAVMTLGGPVLVIAGAGSGKTRTLIYRVARLVETGIAPEAILLLTFTRKSAQEMLDRASELSDTRCRFVSGGTFHALAFKVLRNHAKALGYSNNFTILDRSDMEEVLRTLVPDLKMDGKPPRFPKRGTLANIISKAANLELQVEELMQSEYGQFMEVAPHIQTLGTLYGDYKKTHQLMDYDDLIIRFRQLLMEDRTIRNELSERYAYVMVDEYQDTNCIQADIIKWLAHEHQNVMVVGDDSQSIYSFRGANFRNMLDFPKTFPNTKVIKLEENYRSTQPILALTNALMDSAGEKYTKCLFTKREGGDKPKIIDTHTEQEQATYISRYLSEAMGKGAGLKDFAVLFRAAYHSFELEAELTRQGIPYVKHGGFKFLESAHIKDFLAHMRVVVNADETVSWLRILRLVKNIGQGKSQKIIQWMKDNRIAPYDLAKWPKLGKRDMGLKPLGALLERLSPQHMTPVEAVGQVMGYYIPLLKERYDDYPRRERELEQLAPMAERYGKLGTFLDDLVLDPPGSSADLAKGTDMEKLTLSTVHSAKGLEWPVVFVIWAMEGKFPSARAYNNPLDLEEERRLMYVATTRAKDQLMISYPGSEVSGWSGYSPGGEGLSSFITSLSPDVYLHESGKTRPHRNKQGNASRKPAWHQQKTAQTVKSSSQPFFQGDRVRHPAFGPGVVSKFLSGNKVEVLFKSAGKKLLHLSYTTLEKI